MITGMDCLRISRCPEQPGDNRVSFLIRPVSKEKVAPVGLAFPGKSILQIILSIANSIPPLR